MAKRDWSRLHHLQVGRYAEYLVKMELVAHGLDVYTAEVDNRGIDFVIRKDDTCYYDVQVKSIRVKNLVGANYVFFPKDTFQPRDNLLAAVVLFFADRDPGIYLIPSTVWRTPNTLFSSYDFEGGKSNPEWGVNLCKKSFRLLEPYEFDRVVGTL